MSGTPVIVAGGGVLALSTAYALRLAGCEPTVFAAGTVGSGATGTNAGLLVPADSTVWPGPANARAVPAALLGRSSASIGVHWRDPAVLGWGLRFLANSTASRHAALSAATLALSRHSVDVLEQWTKNEGLAFDFERNGMTFLFDRTEERDAALVARSTLADAGIRYQSLDAAGLTAVDPGYGALDCGTAALYSPDAGHGNAHAFTQDLARTLHRLGVTVHHDRPIRSVVLRDGRVRGVATDTEVVDAAAVVLAAGHRTRALARTAGLRLPILPVKGYSATVPIIDSSRVPAVGGVLETRHVAFSRTETHLRLATGAEIGRGDDHVPAGVQEYLRGTGRAVFGDAADWSVARYEAGHRPMTPHGLPLVGATGIPGLWLNSGHGSLGWTQAAGSADLLAQLLTGTTPAISPIPYEPKGPSR